MLGFTLLFEQYVHNVFGNPLSKHQCASVMRVKCNEVVPEGSTPAQYLISTLRITQHFVE